MTVMAVSGRPQQIGNGSFASSESVAAQSRNETALSVDAMLFRCPTGTSGPT